MVKGIEEGRKCMKLRNGIFNDTLSVILAFGALCSLVFGQFAAHLPLIASAWLVFGICCVSLLYLRAREIEAKEDARPPLLDGPGEMLRLPSPQYFESVLEKINRYSDEGAYEVDPYKALSAADRAMMERVNHAVCQQKIDLFLQPIVGLQDHEVSFYEAFSRLRCAQGQMLMPTDYLDAAVRANHIGYIDNMILLRSVEAVKALQVKGAGESVRIFCNLSPATLCDQQFFALFRQYLDTMKDIEHRLVLEFTYPTLIMDDHAIKGHLRDMADRGMQFSIDHVHPHALDQQVLAQWPVRFIKLSTTALGNMANEGAGVDEIRSSFMKWRETVIPDHVRLIAEKIENHDQHNHARELGLDFGQGNFYGCPGPASSYVHLGGLRQAS